jgi:hypothetical protein
MAVRSAVHRAGAAMLSELLKFEAPPAEPRTVSCTCGHQARYQELRSKSVLTAVGKVEMLRTAEDSAPAAPAASQSIWP